MNRDTYTVREGDRIWPLIDMIRNTWIDDLSDDRIQELVRLVDSWRITDAEGRRINRTSTVPCHRGGHHCRWPACPTNCDGRPA